MRLDRTDEYVMMATFLRDTGTRDVGHLRKTPPGTLCTLKNVTTAHARLAAVTGMFYYLRYGTPGRRAPPGTPGWECAPPPGRSGEHAQPR